MGGKLIRVAKDNIDKGRVHLYSRTIGLNWVWLASIPIEEIGDLTGLSGEEVEIVENSTDLNIRIRGLISD